MKNTCLMCLSSPEGDSNYYSQLLNLKRAGTNEPFFKTIDCLQICDECKKLERTEQIKCTHVKSNAHWLSARKVNELKTSLYQDRPADALREFVGAVVSDYLPALCKTEIARMFDMPRIITQSAPKYIFTCCDPSGGGPSMLSLASAYFNMSGHLVVR